MNGAHNPHHLSGRHPELDARDGDVACLALPIGPGKPTLRATNP